MQTAPLTCFVPIVAILLTVEPSSPAPSEFLLQILYDGANGAYAVSDLDGEGGSEIVVARKPQPLQWMSYPSLKPHTIATGGNIWMEIQSADADGDGDADVLAPDMAANELCWWENPGAADIQNRSSWTRHAIASWDGAFPHDFKVGDIDGDGRLDAVLRTKDSPVFLILMQDGSGTWSTRRLDSAFGPGEGTALGDLDGDGDLDITDGLVWLETPSAPLRDPWARHAFNGGFGCSMTRVAVADINLDGRMDIAVAPSDTSLNLPVVWFEAADPKAGPWKSHQVMPAARANWLHSLQVGDIDKDGYPDVLTGSDHRGSKEMILYLNADRGLGETWVEVSWTTGHGVWQAVLADVSGDGYPDILSADDANEARQELWLNRGNQAVIRTAPRGHDGKAKGYGKPPGGTLKRRMPFSRGGKRFDAGGRRMR
jgi:hypothetical protein